MTKINQKEIAKKYNYLNGKQAKVYIGRISTDLKLQMYGLSLALQCFTGFRKQEPIIMTIRKTHFNGTRLLIYPELEGNYDHVETLVIQKEDINRLKALIQ